MTGRAGQITINFNKKNRAILKTKFGTDDNEKIKEIVYDILINGNTPQVLTDKERREKALADIAEEKASAIKDKLSWEQRKT